MLSWLEGRQDSAMLMSRFADRARTVDDRGNMDKTATVRRFFRLMQSVRTELNRVGLKCCDGANMPRDAETLVYAYVKGGVAAYREALAEVRTRVARRLNLGKPAADIDAGAPTSDEPAKRCPSCDVLAKCCAQVTDEQSNMICHGALENLRAGCSDPPPMPKQMDLSCKAMYKAWRNDGSCR